MPSTRSRQSNTKHATVSPYFPINTKLHYPTSKEERRHFINPDTGRLITPFQFSVYDLCAQIPKGYYSTYKHISDILGASPRAVGQALKVNPFAPSPVPCHRVLSKSTFIGGFRGQWGKCANVYSKQTMLEQEGLRFTDDLCLQPEDRQLRLFTQFKWPME
jgi:O-6-methylguanine DNA methyltransferase